MYIGHGIWHIGIGYSVYKLAMMNNYNAQYVLYDNDKELLEV